MPIAEFWKFGKIFLDFAAQVFNNGRGVFVDRGFGAGLSQANDGQRGCGENIGWP